MLIDKTRETENLGLAGTRPKDGYTTYTTTPNSNRRETTTMGRELQKKKRRSGRQPIRQPNKTKKILNPRGNNIIAKNWYIGLPVPLRSAPKTKKR